MLPNILLPRSFDRRSSRATRSAHTRAETTLALGYSPPVIMAESKKEFPTCISEGYTKPGKMVCPKCKKLGIPGSFFCSQECFKGSWAQHKALSIGVTRRA